MSGPVWLSTSLVTSPPAAALFGAVCSVSVNVFLALAADHLDTGLVGGGGGDGGSQGVAGGASDTHDQSYIAHVRLTMCGVCLLTPVQRRDRSSVRPVLDGCVSRTPFAIVTHTHARTSHTCTP